MTVAAALLRQARTDAGMSIRDLSRIAGVPPSTVSRIEAGRVDPTTGMLTRLLESTGSELEMTLTAPRTPRLGSLVTAWTTTDRGEVIDWTRLRAFLDHLALHPEDTESAIRTMPAPSGSALLDTLLAGVAETLADERGLQRPSWTGRVPALERPWSTPGTPRIRAAAAAATPPALAARGVALARTSLWRERSVAR